MTSVAPSIFSNGRRGNTVVPNFRWEDPRIDPFALRIAGWLASHADHYMERVTRNLIAEKTDVSAGKVSSALHALEELGIIAVERITIPQNQGGQRLSIGFNHDVWENDRPPGAWSSDDQAGHDMTSTPVTTRPGPGHHMTTSVHPEEEQNRRGFQTQDESRAEPVKVEDEKLEEPETFDGLWSALTAIFGEPTMKTGIKKRRLRVLNLEAAKVQPSEINERWVQCTRRWSFTPSEATFIDRWDEFAPPKQPERNKPYYEGTDGKIYSRHNR